MSGCSATSPAASVDLPEPGHPAMPMMRRDVTDPVWPTPVAQPEPTPTVTAMSSIYDLQMESITGEQVDFDQFRDQMLLIVNVASN